VLPQFIQVELLETVTIIVLVDVSLIILHHVTEVSPTLVVLTDYRHLFHLASMAKEKIVRPELTA
jgi:hypothetical protein